MPTSGVRKNKRGKRRKRLQTTLETATSSSNSDQIDLSHVQKPIDTSINSLRKVLSLLDTGTDEVQNYIAYECNIIYECRVCRTIFRSLTNLVLHKQNYCRDSFKQNYRTNFGNIRWEDEFYVIQMADDAVTENFNKQSPKYESELKQATVVPPNQMDNSKINHRRKSVPRRLLSKPKSSLITEISLSGDISGKTKNFDKEQANNVALQIIPSSSFSGFQTIFENMAEEHDDVTLVQAQSMDICNDVKETTIKKIQVKDKAKITNNNPETGAENKISGSRRRKRKIPVGVLLRDIDYKKDETLTSNWE